MNHRCKNRFLRLLLFFIKKAFLTSLICFTFFYFLVVILFILLNLLNSCIKRFLSDEFQIAARGNSLIKNHGARTFPPGQFPPPGHFPPRTIPPGQFPFPTKTIPPFTAQ